MEKFILYISKDKKDASRFCIGSTLCLSTIEYLPEVLVQVKNCDDMRKDRVQFPTWLIGTPTLVSLSGSDIYRGQQALLRLQDMVVSYTEHAVLQRMSKTPSKPTPQSTSARQSVPQAQPQRHSIPDENAENDVELEALWNSKVDDDDAVDETISNGKITGDHLAQAVSQRQQSMQQFTNAGPPPPPPPQEKD